MSANPDMTPKIAEKLASGALGKEVPLDRVDRELEAFFSAGPASEDDEEMLTRASLMNFAVFSESPGALLDQIAVWSYASLDGSLKCAFPFEPIWHAR